MERCILLKFGEMALKGRNRWRFTEQLERNIHQAVQDLGPVDLRRREGVLALFAPDHHDELLERARDVIGVSVVHSAVVTEKTPEAAQATAVELLRSRTGRTFAVRARRRDKRFQLRSPELAALVGGAVQSALGLDVDLGEPDLEVHVEVDRNEIFVWTDRVPGQGGLPVGISGRGLVLLSGGIDSPVAAYRMLKRGLRCDFVHFSGRPYTGLESTYKAYALAGRLTRFQTGARLFIVPFGHAHRALVAAGAGKLGVIAQRRLMIRVACELAGREGIDALVTGDSLGQVSSQTLQNMAVVEAASELPLFRPLVDRDKSEIISEATRLGTFEISTLPDEDCCALLATPIAETRARSDAVARLERRLDVEELVETLVEAADVVTPRVEQPPSAAYATA